MNNVKLLMKRSLLPFCLFFVSFGVFGDSEWYNYGNGMINLDRVTYIDPVAEVSAFCLKRGENNDEPCAEECSFLWSTYDPVKYWIDEGIEEFSSFLQKGCAFSDLTVTGSIKFDDFTLTLAADVFMDAEEDFVPDPEAARKAVAESLRGIQSNYEEVIKIAID